MSEIGNCRSHTQDNEEIHGYLFESMGGYPSKQFSGNSFKNRVEYLNTLYSPGSNVSKISKHSYYRKYDSNTPFNPTVVVVDNPPRGTEKKKSQGIVVHDSSTSSKEETTLKEYNYDEIPAINPTVSANIEPVPRPSRRKTMFKSELKKSITKMLSKRTSKKKSIQGSSSKHKEEIIRYGRKYKINKVTPPESLGLLPAEFTEESVHDSSEFEIKRLSTSTNTSSRHKE